MNCTSFLLSYLTDFSKFVFFKNLDLSTVDSDQFFCGKVGQCTDRIGSSHVGKVCQVFTRKIDTQGELVFFQSVSILQEEQ